VRFTLPLMSALAALSVASAAQAQSAWYISGSAGASFFPDQTDNTTLRSAGTSAHATSTRSFSTGVAVDAAIGYHLPMGFRIEGEFGYLNSSRDSTTIHTSNPAQSAFNGIRFTSPSGGAINVFTATANIFYDIPVNFAGIAPYIGAGVGYYHVSADTVNYGAPFRLTGGGLNQSNAVMLAEAGVTIPLTPNLKLIPAYRYEHFFDDANGMDSHQIKFGLRYDF
jgi:opacity protein-like surface antigen